MGKPLEFTCIVWLNDLWNNYIYRIIWMMVLEKILWPSKVSKEERRDYSIGISKQID